MKKIFASLLVVSMLVLFGCGGGSSGTATATGKFIDAPVAGMTYVSGGQKGITTADGSFTYEVGQNVTFSIGGIVLGTAPGKTIMTPVTLAAAGSTEATPEVVARVQFLMTISTTDTTTGVMTIKPGVMTTAASKSIVWTATTVQTDLTNLTAYLVSGTTLVSQDDAKIHMGNSLILISQGFYSNLKFSSALLSGKTFAFVSGSGHTGNITFNADGTLVVTGSSITGGTSGGTWNVISSGQLVTKFTNSGEINTITITSSTATTITTTNSYTNPSNPSDNGSGTMTLTLGGTSTPTAPSGFTTAMVSGKTFAFVSPSGSTGNITFNANGTLVITGSNPTGGTWNITSSGQLVSSFTSNGEINTLTLTSSTATTIIAADTWTNPITPSDTGSGTLTLSLQTTAPSTGFTTAMLAGKTTTHTMTGGTSVYTFSASGNTYTITGQGAGNGTWLINTSGQLVLTATSYPAGTSYPSVFRIVGGSGNGLVVQDTHNDTPTMWEPSISTGVNFVIQ